MVSFFLQFGKIAVVLPRRKRVHIYLLQRSKGNVYFVGWFVNPIKHLPQRRQTKLLNKNRHTYDTRFHMNLHRACFVLSSSMNLCLSLQCHLFVNYLWYISLIRNTVWLNRSQFKVKSIQFSVTSLIPWLSNICPVLSFLREFENS